MPAVRELVRILDKSGDYDTNLADNTLIVRVDTTGQRVDLFQVDRFPAYRWFPPDFKADDVNNGRYGHIRYGRDGSEPLNPRKARQFIENMNYNYLEDQEDEDIW